MKKKYNYVDEKLEEIEKLVKESSCGILITDKGISAGCTGVDMLTFISVLINMAKKHLPKELIKSAVELGFKSDEEREKLAKESIEKLIDKIIEKM